MPYKDREVQLEAQRNAYHKKKEYYRNLQKKRKQELKTWFREDILTKLKCNKCDENHPSCLDFHHTDPTTKSEGISIMLHKIRTKEIILKELEKCEVLCSNCHRKHHHEERNGDPSEI